MRSYPQGKKNHIISFLKSTLQFFPFLFKKRNVKKYFDTYSPTHHPIFSTKEKSSNIQKKEKKKKAML